MSTRRGSAWFSAAEIANRRGNRAAARAGRPKPAPRFSGPERAFLALLFGNVPLAVPNGIVYGHFGNGAGATGTILALIFTILGMMIFQKTYDEGPDLRPAHVTAYGALVVAAALIGPVYLLFGWQR